MLLNACQKSDLNQANITDDLNKLTPEELVLRNKMEQAALILVRFSNDKEIQKEVQDLIDLKMYKDDFIKFKDLFQPESNNNLKSLKFTKFAEKFRETVSASNLSLKSTEDDFDLEEFLIENDLILYIPYPLSDYPENKQTPTISFHPMTNDSLGIGYKLSKNKSTNNIEEHEVDEGYSEEEPVYIISPNFIDPDDGGDTGGGNPGGGTGQGHFLIRLKHMQIDEQLDWLFAGGSEVRFVFADAVAIDVENRIASTNVHYDAEHKFTRRNIREKDWRLLDIVLDPDWGEDEVSNYFGAVEIDLVGSFTLGIKAAIKIQGVTVTASTGYTIKHGNDFIGQREFPRYYFFASQSNPSLESGETFDGRVVRPIGTAMKFTTEIIEY